jgi:hypothetical protein
MKIRSDIELQNDRYRVQIDTLGFTPVEEAQILALGEPLIDIGSNFSGSISRPGQTNTTVTITPTNGGTGATGTAVVNPDGTIASIAVVGGSGYTGAPTVTVNGDGTGATAHAVVSNGVVTQIILDTPGTGYHAVPYVVAWTEDAALRRIRTEFPIIKLYDLQDFPDADARAKIFSDTIVSRLTAAKTTLVTQQLPFTGEALVTV